MPAIKNITGNKYNSLTVIERAENTNGRVAWKCLCDCGKEKIVRTGDITTGHIKDCGKCSFTFSENYYEFKEGYIIGYTKKGEQFLIDEDDLNKVKDYNIYIDNGYVHITKRDKHYRLHRFLMNPKKNDVIDHINRNPVDNRKENLRICSQSENSRNNSISKNNKSGVAGVSFGKKENKWKAYIKFNKKHIHLGCYDDFNEAVKARKEAEIKYFGEFVPK